jgi:hypothetical protein
MLPAVVRTVEGRFDAVTITSPTRVAGAFAGAIVCAFEVGVGVACAHPSAGAHRRDAPLAMTIFSVRHPKGGDPRQAAGRHGAQTPLALDIIITPSLRPQPEPAEDDRKYTQPNP